MGLYVANYLPSRLHIQVLWMDNILPLGLGLSNYPSLHGVSQGCCFFVGHIKLKSWNRRTSVWPYDFLRVGTSEASVLAMTPIEFRCPPPQRSSDTVGAFCLSEPNSGSDAFALKTKAAGSSGFRWVSLGFAGDCVSWVSDL